MSLSAFPQYDADSLYHLLEVDGPKAELYNLLAEATLEDSSELSLTLAKKALHCSLIENKIRERGMAWFNLGEVYSMRHNQDSAIYFYEKSLDVFKQAGDHYYVSYCLNNLGWIYAYFGHYKKAIEYYSESLKHLDADIYPSDLANVYINLGNVYHQTGSYHTSIDYFHKAARLIRNSDDRASLPIPFTGLGLAYKFLGTYDSAVYYYHRTLDLDKQAGSRYDMAVDYGNLGALYYSLGDYPESYEFHKLALDIYTTEGSPNDLSISYNHLGEIYFKMQRYDSALYYINSALTIDQKTGLEQNMASRYNNLGDVYYEIGDFSTARKNYNKALEINKMKGAQYSISVNLMNLARLEAAVGNTESALNKYRESLKIARSIDSKLLISDILVSISELYASNGQYAKAFAYHRQLDQLEDSIFKDKTRQLLADMQTKHELDRKQKEITLLNKENEIHIEEVRQYRKSTIFFGSAFLVISGLLVILILQYKLRKRAYKKLFLKNKQLVESGKPQMGKNGKHVALSPVPTHNGNGNHRALFKKLGACLQAEKPFLQPDLTVKDLAEKLGTNTHYLSEVINQQFGNSFTGMINEYRIREACRLLAEEKYDHFTIESIASQSGFKSKSAFNNAFKSITGLTPSYYKKSVRNN